MARAKGQGSLKQRSGIWYIRLREGGKETMMSTGKRSRSEALKVMNDMMEFRSLASKRDQYRLMQNKIADTEERMKGIVGELNRVTVAGMVDMFRESPMRPDCSAEMLDRYVSYLTQFDKWSGGKTYVDEVDFDMAEDYARSLRDKAGGTFNKHINALTMIWKSMKRKVGIKENPWSDIPRKKLRSVTREAFTDDEVKNLIAGAKGEMKSLLAIGAYTGLRMGDACHLKWSMIGDKTIKVLTHKTKTLAAIPVLKDLIDVIGRKRAGYVVPKLCERYDKGSHLITRDVEDYLKSRGVVTSVDVGGGRLRPIKTFHSFRHYFVSRAVSAGVPVEIVKGVVGHSSVLMTEHYTHISDNAIVDAFRSMEDSNNR